jgi:major membrane immunogen (membrane-anchored lipoprotein)
MTKSLTKFTAMAAALVGIVGGCSSPTETATYLDGFYTGKSGTDDEGAYGEVSLDIADSKIVDCQYVTYQKDGTIKAEDYGKIDGQISNQDFYNKAQLAVQAMQTYAEQLAKTGSLAGVDAISGATIAYNQYNEAVEQALEQATSK